MRIFPELFPQFLTKSPKTVLLFRLLSKYIVEFLEFIKIIIVPLHVSFTLGISNEIRSIRSTIFKIISLNISSIFYLFFASPYLPPLSEAERTSVQRSTRMTSVSQQASQPKPQDTQEKVRDKKLSSLYGGVNRKVTSRYNTPRSSQRA